MGIEVIIIGISILVISVIIYIIKNNKEIEQKYNTIKNKKIVKIIYIIIIVLISILLVRYAYKSFKDISSYISYYKMSNENKKFFEETDIKIREEKDKYNLLINKEYSNQDYKNPYIPEGFEYVEGEWNIGFVIQDANKNQYVWVPCTNKEIEDVVKLEKCDFNMQTAIRYYNCFDVEYEEFLKSTLENGGFYISRYEIGKQGENIVSKSGAEIYTNITRKEFIEKIDNLYENVNCKLINGFAYDTTLNWIKKNNDIKISKFNMMKEKVLCGRSVYNNIYDFTDNIMEITLEDFYDTVVYRGFDYNENIELESRYNIPEDQISNFVSTNLLSFRTVIYK